MPQKTKKIMTYKPLD